MKMSFAILSFACLVPSAVWAIELGAERECRNRLWAERIGALVTFDVAHPSISRSPMTGILARVEGDQLDFDTFIVKADRVLENSVALPQKGDLISMDVVENKAIFSVVTTFDRVNGGHVYGVDIRVPVAHIVGGLNILKPGMIVYVEYYPPTSTNRTIKIHLRLAGVDGQMVLFTNGLAVPMKSITRLIESPR